MGVNKSDIQCTYVKEHHGNEPVLVALDIEDVTVIPYVVNRIERSFYTLKLAQSACFVFSYHSLIASTASACFCAKSASVVFEVTTIYRLWFQKWKLYFIL